MANRLASARRAVVRRLPGRLLERIRFVKWALYGPPANAASTEHPRLATNKQRLASATPAKRPVSPDPARAVASRALDLLGRRPRVVDVGAQAMTNAAHPYAGLAEITQIDVVGFDPLEHRIAEREAQEGGSVTLFPYALGDGEAHILHVNNDDATSSLFPLSIEHNARFNHLHTLRTVRTELISTRRLDDVLAPGPIDLLKLDVQGAELMVLKGGTSATGRAAVVHCEVQFAALYEGSPLFADIERELVPHGFYLVDLLIPHLYHYMTAAHRTADRLPWADAVFFRETHDPATRAAQALIAAAMYGKLSLAEDLLATTHP